MSGTNAATSAGFLGTDDVATIRMQNLATDIRGFIVCQEHVAGRDRLDMKWQFATYRAGVSLWSQNVRFAPQKQTSDDGGLSAKGHKPTFFGDTPLYCRYSW